MILEGSVNHLDRYVGRIIYVSTRGSSYVGLLKCLVSETDNSQRVTLEPAQLIEPGKEETIIDVYRTLQEDLTIPFEHRRYTMVKLSLPKIVGVATFSEEERER